MDNHIDPSKMSMQLRRMGMEMLAQREHSRRELARKLHEKSNDFEMVEWVLDRLENDNLLSNSRFAESFVRKQGEKGYGPERILIELSERGIDQQLISLYLDRKNPKWQEMASKEASKKVQQMGFQDVGQLNEESRLAVEAFLLERGFSSDMIIECFNLTVGE